MSYWPRTTTSSEKASGKLIDLEDDLEVVAVCADYPSLVKAVDKEVPDVVVTDIRMPPTGTDEGIRAANELRGRYPNWESSC